MDILTTGQTKTSTEVLNALKIAICGLYRDYQRRINTQGVKYGNLFDFLSQKAKEG